MRRKNIFLKAGAAALSLSTFITNCAFIHAAESNFWAERRTHLVRMPKPVLPSVAAEKSADAAIPTGFAGLSGRFGRFRGALIPASGFSGRTVIHIQDIHLNLEAQRNTSSTVRELIEGKKIGLVALEGAFASNGPFGPDPIQMGVFRSFRDGDTTRKVADYLLRTHKISGPIHAALTTPGDLPLFVGIDDATDHAANVRAYLTSTKTRNAKKERLVLWESQLNQREKDVLNPELYKLQQLIKSYRKGDLPLADMLAALPLDGRRPAVIQDFVEASRMEKSLDFLAVEKSRKQVISELVRRMNHKSRDAFFKEALAYRTGALPHMEFYSGLKNLCRQNGVDLARFPAMDAYIRYVLLTDRIDTEALLDALEEQETKSLARLTTTQAEKALLEESKTIYLTSKLLDFSLTPQEWKAYKELFPGANTHRPGSPLCTFEDFYREAETRDQAMSSNLLHAMDRTNTKIAVLVTGGFHAKGIREKLLAQGVSIVTYTPKITRVDTTSGLDSLSIFHREKTPLEQLFSGQKLFVAPPPADFTTAPVDYMALRKLKNPLESSERVFRELAPLADDSIHVEAEVESGASADLVNAKVETPKGTGEVTYVVDHSGNIESVTSQINAWPEIFTMVLLYVTGLGSVAPPLLFSLFIIGSLAARFVWQSGIFIHAFGHVWIASAIRLGHLYGFKDLSEGLSSSEFLRSLIPFSPIRMMGNHAVDGNWKSVPKVDADPLKVRLIAAGGPLMNILFAVWGAWIFGTADAEWLKFIAGSVAFTNLMWALSSISDYGTLYTGLAPFGFFCGNTSEAAFVKDNLNVDPDLSPERAAALKANAPNRNTPRNLDPKENPAANNHHEADIPDWIMDDMEKMGAQTQIRGKQAGGIAVILRDEEGRHYIILAKDVNPKRGNLTPFITGLWRKKVAMAKAKGLDLPENVVIVGHHRFGTSSRPSQTETHPHFGSEAAEVTVMRFVKGRGMVEVSDNFQVAITHNGDNNGLPKDEDIRILNEDLTHREVGDVLERLVGPHEAVGDSPKVARLLTFLRTAGMWDASVKFGMVFETQKSFRNAFAGLTNEQIEMEIQPVADILRRVFNQHIDKGLYPKDAASISQVDPHYVNTVLMPAMIEALRGPARHAGWAPDMLEPFISTTLYAFLNNDMRRALQLYAAMQKPSSTHGLTVMSTLDADALFAFAKGQPLTIGREDGGDKWVYMTASEPAAIFSALDPSGIFFDMDDKNGEIAMMSSKGLEIVSMKDGRMLSKEEKLDRWIPLHGNTYLMPVRPPIFDEPRRDLDEIAKVMEDIDQELDAPESRNMQTINRLRQRIIELNVEAEERRKDYRRADRRAGRIPVEQRNQSIDVLLVAEEKSKESLERAFKEPLEQLCPKLNVVIMTGDEYLEYMEELHGGFTKKSKAERLVVGPQTIAIFCSQSGQTFSTRTAAQLTQDEMDYTRDNPDQSQRKYRDMFILTGEWYSKMGQDLGQSYQPDAPFSERILCNMSGRRVSEAASVAALATDYLLLKTVQSIADGLYKQFPDKKKRPWFIKMSPAALKVWKKAANPFFLDVISQLTGVDKFGNKIDSESNKQIRQEAEDWTMHAVEAFIITIVAVTFTFFSVGFHMPPTRIVTIPILYFLGLDPFMDLGWTGFGLGWLDAGYYAAQTWILIFGLRFFQNRERWARTTARSLVITSRHWKTLSNYATRLMAENFGHMEFFIDGRAPNGPLVHDMAPRVRRGTLILGTLISLTALAFSRKVKKGDEIVEEKTNTFAQEQYREGSKMAFNQAAGIASGVTKGTVNGPEMKIYEAIQTMGVEAFVEKYGDRLAKDEVLRNMVALYQHEINLVQGFVFLEAIADTLSDFRIYFYKDREGDGWGAWLMNTFIGYPLHGMAWVFRLVVLTCVHTMLWSFYGADRIHKKIFRKGTSHSGTAISTTMILPPGRRRNAASQRPVADIARELTRQALPSQGIYWIPPKGQISTVLAKLFIPEGDLPVPGVAASDTELPTKASDVIFKFDSNGNDPVSIRSSNSDSKLAVLDINHSVRVENSTGRGAAMKISAIGLSANSQTGKIQSRDGGVWVEVVADKSILLMVMDPLEVTVEESGKAPRRIDAIAIHNPKPEVVALLRSLVPEKPSSVATPPTTPRQHEELAMPQEEVNTSDAPAEDETFVVENSMAGPPLWKVVLRMFINIPIILFAAGSVYLVHRLANPAEAVDSDGGIFSSLSEVPAGLIAFVAFRHARDFGKALIKMLTLPTKLSWALMTLGVLGWLGYPLVDWSAMGVMVADVAAIPMVNTLLSYSRLLIVVMSALVLVRMLGPPALLDGKFSKPLVTPLLRLLRLDSVDRLVQLTLGRDLKPQGPAEKLFVKLTTPMRWILLPVFAIWAFVIRSSLLFIYGTVAQAAFPLVFAQTGFSPQLLDFGLLESYGISLQILSVSAITVSVLSAFALTALRRTLWWLGGNNRRSFQGFWKEVLISALKIHLMPVWFEAMDVVSGQLGFQAEKDQLLNAGKNLWGEVKAPASDTLTPSEISPDLAEQAADEVKVLEEKVSELEAEEKRLKYELENADKTTEKWEEIRERIKRDLEDLKMMEKEAAEELQQRQFELQSIPELAEPTPEEVDMRAQKDAAKEPWAFKDQGDRRQWQSMKTQLTAFEKGVDARLAKAPSSEFLHALKGWGAGIDPFVKDIDHLGSKDFWWVATESHHDRALAWGEFSPETLEAGGAKLSSDGKTITLTTTGENGVEQSVTYSAKQKAFFDKAHSKFFVLNEGVEARQADMETWREEHDILYLAVRQMEQDRLAGTQEIRQAALEQVQAAQEKLDEIRTLSTQLTEKEAELSAKPLPSKRPLEEKAEQNQKELKGVKQALEEAKNRERAVSSFNNTLEGSELNMGVASEPKESATISAKASAGLVFVPFIRLFGFLKSNTLIFIPLDDRRPWADNQKLILKLVAAHDTNPNITLVFLTRNQELKEQAEAALRGVSNSFVEIDRKGTVLAGDPQGRLWLHLAGLGTDFARKYLKSAGQVRIFTKIGIEVSDAGLEELQRLDPVSRILSALQSTMNEANEVQEGGVLIEDRIKLAKEAGKST